MLPNFIHSTCTLTPIQTLLSVLSIQIVIQHSKPAKTSFQTVRTWINMMWCYQYMVIILTKWLYLACLTRLISILIKFFPFQVTDHWFMILITFWNAFYIFIQTNACFLSICFILHVLTLYTKFDKRLHIIPTLTEMRT